MKSCMILAAGLGTRLKPLTDKVPKPLVKVNNQPVLLRTLSLLENIGIEKVVINLHFKAEKIKKTVINAGFSLDICFSQEAELLETGGGIKQALPLLEDEPFLVINSDAVWLEEKEPLLKNLINHFNISKMDALLALVPQQKTASFRQQQGDFAQEKSGHIFWPQNRNDATYVYTGIHITHPSFIAFEDETHFSVVKPWREAAIQKRLHGFIYKGDWVDMGNHAGLLEAQNLLKTYMQTMAA